MLVVISLLGSLFTLGDIWQEIASPNLSRGEDKEETAGESISSKPPNYQCISLALSPVRNGSALSQESHYSLPHTCLAVGMGVRATHHGSFVFKDLLGKRRRTQQSHSHQPLLTIPCGSNTATPPDQSYTSPSQTCTQGYWAPSSSVTEAHASMTARISGTDMSGSVTSDQGWKHMTLLGGEGRMTKG